jgi:hypothetical protein
MSLGVRRLHPQCYLQTWKIGPRANKCVFIRYSDESKGYVVLGEHPDGGVTEIVSCDVEFMENDFPSRGDVGQSLELYSSRVMR